MIDRYLLRYFLAVVDHGQFSKAAAAAGVSQPTLSIGIARLEELLGARLFVRNNQGVKLTESGTRFLGHARQIEQAFNLAEGSVGEIGEAPLVRIGVVSTVPAGLIAAVLAARDAEGRERLAFVDGSPNDLASKLDRGRIDIAITLRQPGADRFGHETLIEEGYVMALPPGHSLADAGIVPGEAFRDDVMLVRRHCEALAQTSRYFVERGVRPHFAYRTTDDARASTLVQAGLGVTVMPSMSAVAVGRVALAGFDLRRDVGLQYAAHARGMADSGSGIVRAIRSLAGWDGIAG
ncbi:MAG: LysR family transcriptional regulator [Rhizorhabdus sp.]|nr:LysR family transcriptional regulator [Rhizorhabdus sp.]